uniref:C3H1-type domain-containing protein n=1 Tax=Anabas testudineus TaxID=64144 RepID=A0A7N6BZM6_ANATE
MDPDRQKRKEEISKALTFIQSSLAYPEPEEYQDFLTQLVSNLLDEGNALFRDKEWEPAAREFSEGLNVSGYAAGEDIQIPEVLVESLYVNRAAAYHSLGEYEQGVRDCNRALELCKESHRALYRKALCLKELGKYKEAYNCTTDCMLISRLVKEAQNHQHPSKPSYLNLYYVLWHSSSSSLSSLSPCFQTQIPAAFLVPSSTSTHTVSSVLPAPTPQLPPAFFNSSVSQLNCLDSFSGGTSKLDSLDLLISQGLNALDNFSTGIRGEARAPDLGLTSTAMDTLDGLDSLDDFLDTTPSAAAAAAAKKEKNNQAPLAASNALSSTHEFLQACSACFPREGQGIYTYVHKPDLPHTCKRDILLCRRKDVYSEWTRVRPMPVNMSFKGPFVLCRGKDMKSGDLGLCKYGEKCTFAYNQLEIDVWTEERKGTLNRNLLFESDPVNSIIHLLQEHKGAFVFLCQECFDNKPTIISKRCRDDPTICNNLDACHTFDANKCLVFVVSAHNVTYKKVRPLSVMCQLDLCRQEIRYGCQRGDNCHFAHSCIELKTWRVQQHTGISHEEIVKVSTKYYENQGQNSSGDVFGGGGRARATGKSLNMKMKFACAQCWRDGLISEPDKALKYCTAKARHAWTKDRRVLLVKSLERSKWVQVRPLPQTKNPLQYDICTQMLDKKKCNYHGNCTFAHSQEEKEMWMYMKNNELFDMQQMYNLWLASLNHTRQADEAVLSQPAPEDKYIAMPTDYAELMSDFYCRLCGKHSNSERQWQQHISSEKHKDRVFSCEGEEEALMWSYRFPGKCFELCPKLDGGCPDGVSCDYAHSVEELQEWKERRDFLQHKLAKAREDMLVMPDESDFGKYNFLLQD